MRSVTIDDQSWAVDDADQVVGERAERFDSADPIEAAAIHYGYARI